ncbi:MAG: penicillin-binding protein 2 [Armatimonadetes bacterium]|nr:penicillin-binding protein 2 [Armatimonadota bacterium]MDW8121326.1 penicillin-binding protein 2 [Armatimonadota bacterium]
MNQSPLPRRRLFFLAVILGLSVAAFLIRLVWLQILEGAVWSQKAQASFLRAVTIRAPRGTILDRKGRPLAISQPSFTVALLPAELASHSPDADELSKILQIEPSLLRETLSKIRDNKLPLFEPVPIKVRADMETVTRVLEWGPELHGVAILEESTRVYPQGSLAAHLLGYIGRASKSDIEKWSSLHPLDWTGKSGIERFYEPLLRGQPGHDLMEVDALGSLVRRISRKAPTKGQTLTLSVDLDLQKEAEEALRGRPGAVVVMKPSTGEVLAMASYPSFDPNWFSGGIDRSRWKSLTGDRLRPLHNRAIGSAYPPGSVFKVVTAVAGLLDGTINRQTRISCSGGKTVGRRFFRCWRRHGSVTLVQAIAQSCDTYFYTVALAVGPEKIYQVSRAFGLSQRVGIDLPGEAPGVIGSPQWKKRRFGIKWFGGDTANMGIGQGFVAVTPLQMALMAAMIANKGRLVRPRLLKESRLASGETDERPRPEIVFRLAPGHRLWDVVHEGMIQCVHGPAGTAKALRGLGFTVAGKTGSAQFGPSKKTHSCFICYAPAENPEIAIAVIAETAGHGSEVAVPIANRILQKYASLKAGGSSPLQQQVAQKVAFLMP